MNVNSLTATRFDQSLLDYVQNYYTKKNSKDWFNGMPNDLNANSQFSILNKNNSIFNYPNFNQSLMDALWGDYPNNKTNNLLSDLNSIPLFLSMKQRIDMIYNLNKPLQGNSQYDFFKNKGINWWENLAASQGSINTISIMGMQINNISKTIEKSGDKDALAGFNKIMVSISTKPADLQNMLFIEKANTLASGNPEALKQFFSTLNILDKQKNGISIDTYLNTFNTTINKTGESGLSNLNSLINQIHSAPYDESKNEKNSAMVLFFNLYNGILNSGNNEKVMNELKDFTDDIKNLKSGSDIFLYLAGYQIKI